jgi:hypothetical protein
MYKTNPIGGGRTCDLVKAFCKTNPIFVGTYCRKSSYHCHSGVAVLCALCVSVVKVPFCKTKPISGKPMPGTLIAKRSQFSSEHLAWKAVITVIPAWPFSASSVSLWWKCRFAKRSQFWGNRCLEPPLQNEPNFRPKALLGKQLSLSFRHGRSLCPLCLCGGIAVLQNEPNFKRNLLCTKDLEKIDWGRFSSPPVLEGRWLGRSAAMTRCRLSTGVHFLNLNGIRRGTTRSAGAYHPCGAWSDVWR